MLVRSSEAGVPSFDCAKARAWSEQYICQDSELATFDREMAELYRTIGRENAGQGDEHKAVQRTWMKQRENCQSAKEPKNCLVEHYQQRLAVLKDNAGTNRMSVRGSALTPAVVWDHSDMIYEKCEFRILIVYYG